MNARLAIRLGQIGGSLVVERGNELLRGKIVDVVLAVEKHLLEAVAVAARLRGRQSCHRRKQVGGHVVQRPALEAAVAVEHHQCLVLDRARLVAAGRECDGVVAEIVARAQHEAKDGVGAVAVGLAGKVERLGDVAKAARIRFAGVEDDGVDQRLVARVFDLDEIGMDAAL